MNGYGADEQVISNDVQLLAASSVVKAGLRVVTFAGAISGKGSVKISTAGNNDYCRTWFRKPVDVAKVECTPSSAHPTVPFDLSFFSTLDCDKLLLSKTNVVASFSVGSSPSVVTSEIAAVEGFAADLATEAEWTKYPCVCAKAGTCVRIGDVTGRLRLRTEGDGVILYRGMPVSTSDSLGVLLVNGDYRFLPSDCRFVIPASSEVDISKLPSMPVKVDGTARISFAPWAEPTLWLDASAAGTVSNLWLDADVSGLESRKAGLKDIPGYADVVPFTPAVTLTNGAPAAVTEYWIDRRGEAATNWKTYNDRHRSNEKGYWPSVYPLIVTNGLAGRTIVAMDRCASTSNRRFNIASKGASAAFSPRFVTMVFGSQGGGGNALLACDALGRGYPSGQSSNSASYHDPIATNVLFKTGHVWVDGVAVDPTQNDVLNGGWQVISIDLAEKHVNGLGYWKDSRTESGGQSYAEVLFFDVAPTDDQRVAVETYLAHKWGLTDGYKGTAAAPLALNAYGTGEIAVDGCQVAAAGSFAGRIRLSEGAHYVVGADLLPIPTAEDVATIAGRTSWFDPDQEGAIKYFTEAKYAACVNILYDRVFGTTGGAYVLASASGRAPSVEQRTTDFGSTRRWLQYANVNPTETNKYCGNALRVNTLPKAYDNDVTPVTDTRTVLMVMDSSQGGGCPFLDGTGVGGSKIIRFGSGSMFCKDWTKPIWSTTAATTYFDASVTYLNGQAVDGRTRGFTGGPELLTAVAGSSFELSATGGYAYKDYANASGDTDPHTDVGEIQGEMLTFNKVLSDADRQKAEAYLMYKWLGFLPSGSAYGSASAVTVSGEGVVEAPSAAALPRFGDFTGTVDFTAPLDLSFSVAKDGTITTPLAFPTVRLADGTQHLTVTSPEGLPDAGDYTLVTAAGGLLARDWTFDVPDGMKIRQTDTSIVLRVPAGTVLMIR